MKIYRMPCVKYLFDLYEEGLIYRGKRLVNWDPVLLTAISDLEVINEEEEGNLWHIRYPLGMVKVTLSLPLRVRNLVRRCRRCCSS